MSGCGCFFFFKQKTAYEMRISDWSSDVCSSDLLDFAAEVGMPGRVDDVDAVALPGDGGVLGQDRDATFLFLVVAVHHALGEHGAFEIGRASCRERVCQYV